MLGNIGPLEIGIVLVIALLVFGPKKLPDLGHGLGKGMREFKEGITGDGDKRTDRPAVGAAPPADVVATTPGADNAAQAPSSADGNG
ncbi:MAG: twin-arginine translocase TatA/TatE family subunit [Actinobacteria bacterium]|nr:twin-arginine translocase TatA/TatE family subunit [Actinomycetota bacterium]